MITIITKIIINITRVNEITDLCEIICNKLLHIKNKLFL